MPQQQTAVGALLISKETYARRHLDVKLRVISKYVWTIIYIR